jgi:excisionase family DNA binding protein
MTDRILTVKQAAELLQLEPQTIRDYLQNGKIPGHKVGIQWRVLESDLRERIEAPWRQPVTTQDETDSG